MGRLEIIANRKLSSVLLNRIFCGPCAAYDGPLAHYRGDEKEKRRQFANTRHGEIKKPVRDVKPIFREGKWLK